MSLLESVPAGFGTRVVVGRHRLCGAATFEDAALVELLDRMPRAQLFAMHMGRDPARLADNRAAAHDGVPGAELLRAVQRGRLWLNLTRIDRADSGCRALIRGLYDELGEQVPGFRADSCQGTLLISSPGALVYYHADGPASVLWHLRGRKRVWVYPALDPHYVSTELLEDITAGVRHEYLPYDPGFDAGAQVFDLEPGQWIAWPQNAPHRVTNLDGVNVSLSTEHFTAASRRRSRLYAANGFFRRRLGRAAPSLRERGPVALMKVVSHRLARVAGLDPVQYKKHRATLRVDADAPDGVRDHPP